GADSVILLSHMGIEHDRRLAAELQEELPLIIGAHSHTLLSKGERLGKVMLVQAGAYAQHLGCIDLLWNGSALEVQHVCVLPITDDIPPASEIVEEAARIEEEIAQTLAETMSEVIADLAEPLTFAADQECGTANLMADMLRERMQADLALITSGVAFSAPLPAGPLTRRTLWETCSSPANPGVVEMTGEQLQVLIRHGLNPDTAAKRPGPLRGQAQGLLHLSGAIVRDGTIFIADAPLDLARRYRVAGSDWELDKQGGYTKAEWGLHPTYDIPTILREALDAYLRAKRGKIRVSLGRLDSSRCG
ncbi:MAG TPA: 5'-nucleotidase C-terminal domain-containing protein, partial [Ktedonobacteraceae bacterium]|nr:5'-nucleotidase C-terminal domain-containing protein [Ktedonobacteraceae bacterium]